LKKLFFIFDRYEYEVEIFYDNKLNLDEFYALDEQTYIGLKGFEKQVKILEDVIQDQLNKLQVA
jgi:hypothetical protein